MQRLFLLILVASAVGGYMQYIHNPEPVAASDQTQIAWEPQGHLRPSPWSTAGQGSGFTVQTVVAPAGTADFQTGMSYWVICMSAATVFRKNTGKPARCTNTLRTRGTRTRKRS